MKNENTDNDTEADCPSAPCSPSSLTTETDQLHAQRENVHSAYFLMRTHAERLERQRNGLIVALEYIAHAGLSGRHMEDVARAALSPENV
jgi:hypothetical protein